MSKMDNLRAMREAKFDRNAARAKGTPATRPALAPVAPPLRIVTEAEVEAALEPDAGEELCGHRNMSGRTCTREKGHSAKSHRYS
jgi:hypothetical protein